jgi:uncharacterized lipoprotein NlpE involved in copper resistance
MKNINKLALVVVCSTLLVGCNQESEVASYNVSQAAHNFEVNRRVVFYNGITGEYILTIEGLLSVTPEDKRLSVIVKTGPKEYKKHYLGVSDNVTWFCEQIAPVNADPFHYRVMFRPTTIVPDVDTQVR